MQVIQNSIWFFIPTHTGKMLKSNFNLPDFFLWEHRHMHTLLGTLPDHLFSEGFSLKPEFPDLVLIPAQLLGFWTNYWDQLLYLLAI